MAQIICRFYPDYTNAPKDVICEWEYEARCCQKWFLEKGVPAEIVKQSTVETILMS